MTRRTLLLTGSGLTLAAIGAGIAATRPKNLDQVARPVPVSPFPPTHSYGLGAWLSEHEVINGSEILDLTTGTTRPLPLSPDCGAVHVVNAPYTVRSQPIPSPDGKWLLYNETTILRESSHSSWVVVAPDGWQKKTIPRRDELSSNFFWLPDNSGWLVLPYPVPDQKQDQGVLYSLSGETKPLSLPQSVSLMRGIQDSGQLLVQAPPDQFALYRLGEVEPVKKLVFKNPRESSQTKVHEVCLSRDGRWFLAHVCVYHTPLPEQGTWEVLFNNGLPYPEKHAELWLIPVQGGTPHCLAIATGKPRDIWHNDEQGQADISLLSWSPKATSALIWYYGKTYLLPTPH